MTEFSGRARGRKRQASFLVRFWWESREAPDQEPVWRGYLRSLHTHEEHYVGDPDALGERIKRLAIDELGHREAVPENLERRKKSAP